MRLPDAPGFRRWVAAETLSTLGDSVTFFALAWAATGLGAATAGVILTLESVPLAALMLVGGVTADRWGIRRTMVGCDLAMAVVSAAAAVCVVLTHRDHTSYAVTLGALGFLAGTAQAMRRPAEGVFARLFVDDEELPRLLATLGVFAQIVRMAGPAVGGVLVATAGVGGTLGLDAVTFALVATALIAVRPPRPDWVADAASAPPLRAVTEALTRARRTPGVPAMLVAVVGLAGSILPFVMLVVPAAGHHHHWGAATTGIVSAAWVAGSLALTAVVARRGAWGRRAMLAGTVVGALGMVVAAAASSAVVAAVGVAVVGVGTSLTTTRLLPLFQTVTPKEMLARFQSMLQLAQTGATLIALPALGAVLAGTGPLAAGLVAAALLLVTFAALLRVPVTQPAERASVDVG